MKAIILAGGFGTRLQDVVRDRPKSMALIAGKPFLEHQIRALKAQGIKDIVLCVHYMANTIKSYFGDGRQFGVEITYSDEEIPMGTAGAIKKAEKYIDDTFLVMNGDSLSKIDVKEFLDFHKQKRSFASMGLITSKDPKHYGRVIMDGNRIAGFFEKSGEGYAKDNVLINSGAYIFEPWIFNYIESEKKVSLEKEVFPKLAQEGKLYGYPYEGYFIDIGRPETYAQFQSDTLKELKATASITVREAMKLMNQRGTDVLFITENDEKLIGVINDRIINRYIIGGGNVDVGVSEAMVKDLNVVARIGDSEERIRELMVVTSTRRLPILDKEGRIVDIRFRAEEIENAIFPVARGRSPMRISFAGGGTDIPQFFEKYGGVVINTTITKYVHGTAIKRADSKITINSDHAQQEVILDQKNLGYDGGDFDLIKAVIKIIKPDFGFDLYLHNDIPPGRGLGSSASAAVLVTKLIGQLQGIYFDDEKVAEIAFRAERDELGIKGGWQDQYAAATGGFIFMEFNKDKRIIYPLKLKEIVVNELASHLTLCYVGHSHHSGKQQEALEKAMNEEEIASKMNRMKDIAVEIKDALLTGCLQKIGELLHESWENKRELNKNISNPRIDELYEAGKKNGAYGGKLLGSGGGGYILFYHPPEKRNKLIQALKIAGGEILDFDFDFKGAEVWTSNLK